MTQILSQLEGNQLVGFILVLARVTPLFFLAPLFSSPMVPPHVRGLIAVGISVGLAPIALHGQHIPTDAVTLVGLIVEGMLVGLGFAFSIAVLFAAVDSAGSILDVISGFSYGSLINPFNGNQAGILSQFYSLVGTTIFLIIGGDAWMLKGIAKTFQLVPLTSAPEINSLVGGAERVFSTVFTSALEIAAPVMIALFITDVAFGVVSRVVPQLNVFAVAFPAKVGVALVLVAGSLPFMSGWLSSEVSTSVGAALGALHVA